MKQIVSNYSYSPATNVVTLTGVNIDADQLLLIVAPQVGRTLYNFASVTGTVVAGADTRVTLNASTAGLTTTSPLVVFYDDQASAQTVTGTVALDPASLVALENVTVTIGSSVTVGGTVTANVVGWDGGNAEPFRIGGYSVGAGDTTRLALEVTGIDGNPIPISGTVTANVGKVGYDGGNDTNYFPIAFVDSPGGGLIQVSQDSGGGLPISGTVTANGGDGTFLVGGLRSGLKTALSLDAGTGYLQTKVESMPAISGTVTVGVVSQGAFGATINGYSTDTGGQLFQNCVPVKLFHGSDARLGAVTVGNSVTIGSLPSGALTTRFGSVTTANTAQITSAVTNTSRKYLLAQNISAGTVTIGIGFSPTTTQGIQLTAGGGLTFDAFCPTGAVYWLGAVTGANYCLIEG